MRNIELIRLLKDLDPDQEVCIEIHNTHTRKLLDASYAIDYDVDEYGALVLKVSTDKHNQ